MEMEPLVAVASEGTAVEDQHSTFVDFVAIEPEHHTCDVGRAQKGRQSRQENSIAEYGRLWEGKGATFERPPSRRVLFYSLVTESKNSHRIQESRVGCLPADEYAPDAGVL
jgi:hypothetical protein